MMHEWRMSRRDFGQVLAAGTATVAAGARPAGLAAQEPETPIDEKFFMAIHGHGKSMGWLGLRDDYHHAFALRLAQAGHLVLCAELRTIYSAFGAERYVSMHVSPGRHHEIDTGDLHSFLADGGS